MKLPNLKPEYFSERMEARKALSTACSPDVVTELLDALEHKHKLLRDLTTALKLDRHEVEDWPTDSRNAVEAITKEIGA